jgi:type VI secretion system protein ImpG
MTDRLDRYFEEELAALLRRGSALSGKDAIGKRLGISRDQVADPHVARLLEGVAYLGARVQARLDDEFPELTEALLGVLYPHFLLPFPSCLMTQLSPMADHAVMSPIAKETTLLVGRDSRTQCRFTTTAAVDVWPIRVEGTVASGLPLPPLKNPLAEGANGAIRLTLSCLDPNMTFDSLMRTNPKSAGIAPLRLHLRGRSAREIYQLLSTAVLSVAIADGPADRNPVCLGPEALAQGGFAPADALIPWPDQGAAGFRHLLEYFAFPEKFLCVDLHGLDRSVLTGRGNTLDVFIYLRDAPGDLERAIVPDCFGLFCVPAVNLFARRCEPVTLDGTRTEYPVDPSRTGLEGLEVWTVDEVRETLPDGSARWWSRLFGTAGRSDKPEYDVIRRPARGGLAGEEVVIGVVAPKSVPKKPERSQLAILARCTNRDLPAALDSEPPLRPEGNLLGVASIRSLGAATPPGRRKEREVRDARGAQTGARRGAGQRDWYLISHLAMNHLPLGGGGAGADMLREVVAMYDVLGSAETRAVVAAIVGVSSQASTARLPGAQRGVFCRGLDVTVEFDAKSWRGQHFLFAAVLDRFFAAQARVNSFVRTIVKLQGQREPVMRWPARAESRVLP